MRRIYPGREDTYVSDPSSSTKSLQAVEKMGVERGSEGRSLAYETRFSTVRDMVLEPWKNTYQDELAFDPNTVKELGIG